VTGRFKLFGSVDSIRTRQYMPGAQIILTMQRMSWATGIYVSRVTHPGGNLHVPRMCDTPHLVRKLQPVISARDAVQHYHISICYILQVVPRL